MSELILVRHAECYKNIRDEHGGYGDVLTGRGKRQLPHLARAIGKLTIQSSTAMRHLWYSKVIQITQTADYLLGFLGIPGEMDERILPLDLGGLAGLSKDKAYRKYPDAATRLELWRTGKLEIQDLNIPAAESFASFWHRGNSFINDKLSNNTSGIIVGSRSILILLLNILLNRTPIVKGQYHPWDFSCCSITQFRFSNKWDLIYSKGVRSIDGKVL